MCEHRSIYLSVALYADAWRCPPLSLCGVCVPVQAAGAGTNTWRLQLDVHGRAPIAFKVTGLRQAATTYMHSVKAALPDWVDQAITLAVATATYTV
jgi:hypothetical protein